MSSTQPEPADERLRAQPDEPPLTADERLRADDAVQPDERLRADAQPAAGSDGDDNVTASKKTSLTSHWDVLPVELKAKIVRMVAFPVGDFEILGSQGRVYWSEWRYKGKVFDLDTGQEVHRWTRAS